MLNVTFRVDSSLNIDAPIADVYQAVSNFETWSHWSPWLCTERSCPVTIEGEAHNIDHSQQWDGKYIGAGKMNLTALEKNKSLTYNIEFTKPWKSKVVSNFSFEENGKGTQVTWSLDGNLPVFMFWMKKMMKVLINKDYDRGLLMLKDFMQLGGKVPNKISLEGVVGCEAFTSIGIERQCNFSNVSSSMSDAFAELKKLEQERNLPTPDFYLTVYKNSDPVKDTMSYVAALGYEKQFSTSISSPLVSVEYPKHRSMKVTHLGPYRHLANAWTSAYSYQRTDKVTLSKEHTAYERYVKMPEEVQNEAEVQTDLYFPVKQA